MRKFRSFEGVREAKLGELQQAVGPLLGQRLFDEMRRFDEDTSG